MRVDDSNTFVSPAKAIAHQQMRRDGTARTVLGLLAITGVVVSAIVAKQATVARQSAFASPPMMDVSLVDHAGNIVPPRASIAIAPAASAEISLSEKLELAQLIADPVSTPLPAVVTLFALPADFVGPPEPWRLGVEPAPPFEELVTIRDDLLWLSRTKQSPSPGASDEPPPLREAAALEETADASTRWFHGRTVRPKRVLWMRVTAYSPDERSCPGTADGRTATMHCVSTNDWHLVAADPKVLPLGSMISVPGYGKLASGEEPIVPVLDIGSAIKGERLDVLFPTHEQAMKWGVKDLPVVIWEYADGQPFTNPRKAR